MRLLEIRLSDMAGIATRHVSLQAGINLIAGGNAAGKSILVRAMQGALLDKDPAGGRRHRQGAPPAVAIRVEQGGETRLLERVFDADAGTATAPLISSDVAAAIFWLQGGMLSAAESSVRQLVRRLSMAEEPHDAAVLQRLQDDYRRLTSHDPWGNDREEPGELERVRGRLAEIELAWEERLSVLRELGRLRDEHKEHIQPPTEKRPLAAPSLPDVGTPAEASVRHEAFEDELITPSSDVAEEFWEDELDAAEPVSDPAKVRERLWAVQKEAAALRQELVAVPTLSTLLPAVLTVLFLVLGGALAIFQRGLWQEAVLSAAALMVCTWGIFAVLARNRGSDMARLRERLGRAESERESLLRELDRLDELRRYGSTDPGECLDEPVATAVIASPPVATEAVGVDDAERSGVAAEAPRATLWQERRQLLAELSDLRALEMEGETLRYQEQQLVRRLKVLTTAIEMLLQAEDHFSGGRRAELSDAVNRQLQRLAPGISLQLSLGSSWYPEVLDASTAQPRSLQELSRGERTLASLAVHLVLLGAAAAAPLPLVADDLLDDLHRDWRESVLAELGHFAKRHQVVLTCRDPELSTRALTAGWHIISLDEAIPSLTRKQKPKPAPERNDDEQQLHLL